jgi:tetratricopeptide (TPR) repeat protein
MKVRTSVSISILVLAVLILTGNCTTTTQATEEHPLVVQREFELQGTKLDLFGLANEWMENTLIDAEEGIQYCDEEAGVIVGQGTTLQQSDNGFDVAYEFGYEITVRVKDNKATTTIECHYGMGEIQENITMITEPHLLPREDYEELKGRFNAMIDNLATYMKNGSVASEYNKKGIAKAETGDYEGAIGDFTKAVECRPYGAGSYDNRGIAKRLMGDYEGAIADHNKALELSPNYYAVYNNRGTAKLFMGDYEGAIADYSRAIDLNPGHYSLYMNRSNAKSDSGDYEGAISDLTKAIELNPDLPYAFNNRGWIFVKQERYLDAISDLNKALAITNDACSYDTRGWALFFLNRLEEARQDAISALELDSEAFNARALLFRIEVREGNAEEALASLKNYISNHEGAEVKDQYFLILKYFANDISLEHLKNNPQWDDLSVALRNY